MRSFTTSLLLAAAAALGGCTSVFLQPDHVLHLHPDRVGAKWEDAHFESADGTALTGIWFPASRQPAKGVVVQFHGNGENMTSHFLYVAWLAERGYDVIAFDYRGYGDSDGVAERAGIVEDARAAIRFAAQKGGDLYVVAQSLGGAIALPALVAEKPPALRAVALDSTFASYRGIARKFLAKHWFSWALQWPLSFLVSDELSPVDAAQDFHWRGVVLHAPDDPIAPYAEGRELYEALASPMKEFWEVPSDRHTFAFSDAKEAQIYKDKLVDFFNRARRAPPALPGSPGTRRKS
jgi:alpha-beta hydrolase superfamily lysophospholipase